MTLWMQGNRITLEIPFIVKIMVLCNLCVSICQMQMSGSYDLYKSYTLDRSSTGHHFIKCI